jgi:hypothetical protein
MFHHWHRWQQMEMRGELHTSAISILWETVSGTHWIRGWLGRCVGLDGVEVKNVYCVGNQTLVFHPIVGPRTD